MRNPLYQMYICAQCHVYYIRVWKELDFERISRSNAFRLKLKSLAWVLFSHSKTLPSNKFYSSVYTLARLDWTTSHPRRARAKPSCFGGSGIRSLLRATQMGTSFTKCISRNACVSPRECIIQRTCPKYIDTFWPAAGSKLPALCAVPFVALSIRTIATELSESTCSIWVMYHRHDIVSPEFLMSCCFRNFVVGA